MKSLFFLAIIFINNVKYDEEILKNVGRMYFYTTSNNEFYPKTDKEYHTLTIKVPASATGHNCAVYIYFTDGSAEWMFNTAGFSPPVVDADYSKTYTKVIRKIQIYTGTEVDWQKIWFE